MIKNNLFSIWLDRFIEATQFKRNIFANNKLLLFQLVNMSLVSSC